MPVIVPHEERAIITIKANPASRSGFIIFTPDVTQARRRAPGKIGFGAFLELNFRELLYLVMVSPGSGLPFRMSAMMNGFFFSGVTFNTAVCRPSMVRD